MQRAHVSTVRQQLIDAREDKEWSQERLADELSVDRMTIRRWELGTSFPRSLHLRKLCKVLRKTAEELGFGKAPSDETSPTPEEKLTKSEESAQENIIGPDETLEDIEEPDGTTLENIEEPDDPAEEEYQDFRRSSLVLRFFLCIKNYPRNGAARYHELQRLLILELRDNKMNLNELSRREASKLLAAMPVEYCGLSALKPVFQESHNEILLQCGAGITACWDLRKGPDITFAAQTVAKYIPTLKEIARIGAPVQRREAAELLVHCFLLLSVHSYAVIMGAPNAAAYAQKAEVYANIADNVLLQIIALRTLSASYHYAGDWKRALHAGQKAKSLLETTKNMSIPLLVQSYVHGGMATYQSYFGLEDDAKDSLKQAHAAFGAQPEDESAPICVDYTIGALLLDSGRTHAHFGLHKEAITSFEKMNNEHARDISTPFATRISLLIDQIVAELTRTDKSRDMDWCIENWEKALAGARALGSTSKEDRVAQAHTAMLGVWPKEREVIKLRELLIT